MANKGGTLANIGQALSGYGSALSGNPLYLQNSLILRQANEQRRTQEEQQRQQQVGDIASRALMRGGSQMNDENKMGMLRLMAPGAFQSAIAQQAMSQLFPQPNYQNVDNVGLVDLNAKGGPKTVIAAIPSNESSFPKAGTTRSYRSGTDIVEEEADGRGGWNRLGVGPAFKPESPNAADTYKRVDYWREKIDPEYKAVNEAAISFDKIERAIQGGASMSTAIQLLQKIIDERGVVRGEDVRMFNDAQPLIDAWRQELKTSTSGQLTKESAERVLNTARALVGARYNAFNNNFQSYAPLMQGESVKPTDVIPQQALDRFSMRRFQPPPPPGAAGTAQASGAGIPTPQTEADYNQLPSGAVYIDPDDGRQYRKP
jgi:hypothetical protein